MTSQRVKFAPVPQVQQDESQLSSESAHRGGIVTHHHTRATSAGGGGEQQQAQKSPRHHRKRKMWTPGVGLKLQTSPWIIACLAVLLLSNILFMMAFVTNGWGVLLVMDDPPEATTTTAETGVTSPPIEGGQERVIVDWWGFGLWQTCRASDGLCLGTRFPAFYSATRAFAVLGLFGHILTFALMLGHTLERLLDNDTCTMATLISMIYSTSVFLLIMVSCFGARWAADFRNEFSGTVTYLSFSYYLAVLTVPLTALAASLAVVDLVKGRQKLEDARPFSHHDVSPYYDQSELDLMDLEETLNRERHKDTTFNLKSLA